MYKPADRREGREPMTLFKEKMNARFLTIFILILRILLVVGACAKLAAFTVARNRSSILLCPAPAHVDLAIYIYFVSGYELLFCGSE
jgi:hypothetical protein